MGDMMDLWLPPKPAIIRPSQDETRQFSGLKKANFAPGWFPGGAMAGVPLTLSFVASAFGDNIGGNTVTAPATVLAGDVIVVFENVRDLNGAVPTTGVPSGFTSAVNTAGSDGRAICSYKIAVGNEDGATIAGGIADSGGGVTDPSGILLLMFRGSRPITGVTVGSAGGSITSGNPSGQTVTASGGIAPLIVLGSYMADQVIDNTTFDTPGASGGQVTLTNQHLEFSYAIYNTAPQDSTVDNDDEGGSYNGVQGFYLSMS